MNVNAYIQGGLGNQFFAYAATRSLADRVGADLNLDLNYLAHDAVYKRQFELDSLNVRFNQISSTIIKPIQVLRKARYYALSRTTTRILNFYCEKRPFKYQTFPENWENELTLEGYWQSERYFSDNAKQIAKDLTFKDVKWMEADLIAQAIRQSPNSTFLHIRSYKEVPGCSDGRASLPVGYYVSALKELKSRVDGDLKVFVFSDDLNWAREKLIHYIDASAVFVEPIRDGSVNDTYRDFQLMRLCLHAIVANSSFSWWAGWLGEQDWLVKGKMPIRIRANRHCLNDDYWPNRWLPVPCE